MGETICIASGKGGTGKSSVSAALAGALAALGKSVLLVDLDIGLRNLDLVLGLTEAALFDFTDVLFGRVSLKDAVCEHPECPGLFFLAAPLGAPESPVTAESLAEFTAQAKACYDFCILDCPAGLGEGFSQAAAVADRAIVVCTADQTSLRDAQMTRFALLEHGVEDLRLVLNRMQKRVYGIGADDAIDKTGLRLLGVVPEDKRVISCANRGELLQRYPKAPAARAFSNIAQRLLGVEVPLLRQCRF